MTRTGHSGPRLGSSWREARGLQAQAGAHCHGQGRSLVEAINRTVISRRQPDRAPDVRYTEPAGQPSYPFSWSLPIGVSPLSSCCPLPRHRERPSHGWGCRAQQGGPDGSPASRGSLEERCPAPTPSVLPGPPPCTGASLATTVMGTSAPGQARLALQEFPILWAHPW